jgi:hypothetical protein
VTNTLAITYVSTDSLRANPLNPRTHPPSQLRQVTKSIRTLGFINPIVTDAAGNVVAGHARLLAAQKLGLQTVPTIQVGHLTESQLLAYALADNRIAENAGWDSDLLRISIEQLLRIDTDFDVDAAGFSVTEVDLHLQPAETADTADETLIAPPDPTAVVTEPGDLWQLGLHRVLCGDCREEVALERLLDGRSAKMVITDPPFNVRVQGHVSGLGRHRHAEFAMASGEMSEADFCAFLHASLGAMVGASATGAVHFVCMDWRHLPELYSVAGRLYGSILNLCVWVKSNGGMGSLYRSQHELVLVARVGDAPHRNNVELGKNGRYRTNVWQYAGMNAFGAEREAALAAHPTVKPVQLIADAILDVTARRDVVLDGFLGSGTTILAAERTGRIGCGIEIDPGYVDVAIQRWQALTGGEAIHVASGETFAVRAAARRRPAPDAED